MKQGRLSGSHEAPSQPCPQTTRARGRGFTGHSGSSDTECPSQLGTSPSLHYWCTISPLLDVRTVSLLGKSVYQADAAEKPPEGQQSRAVHAPWSHECPCQGRQKPWPRKHRAAFLMGKLLDHPIKMRLLVSTWKRKDPPEVFHSSVVLMKTQLFVSKLMGVF